MAKFKAKPFELEAEQFLGGIESAYDLIELVDGDPSESEIHLTGDECTLAMNWIGASARKLRVAKMCWVVKIYNGSSVHVMVEDPVAFAEKYELAEE